LTVARRRIAAVRGEILTGLALLAGWALLTSAIAQLVRPDVVWRASAGIFLLSLCGWKFLYTIASSGLYKLTLPRGR
jgi:hypothetical protein